jgi:Ala-tRNA(Pro) deacylase
MAHTPEDLFAHLEELGIETTTVSHEPVFTVEQARAARSAIELDGVHIKNLFLRNKKKRMWLVVVEESQRVNLKELGKRIDAGHLSFGSAKRLMQYLGVEPGAVTPFGVINDTAEEVAVVLDERVANAGVVHCHPLVNDKTTAIAVPDLLRFLESCGHRPRIVNFDAVEA